MVKSHAANRVSIPQIEFLALCMEQFPSLALANFGRSREESYCTRNRWLHISLALNKIKPGVMKTGVGWLRYWTIYKYQLRKRYPQFKSSWMSSEPVRVTPLEERFLRVLADCERNQSSYTMDNERTKSSTAVKEAATGNDLQSSQSLPNKQENSQSMLTKQETSQDMPTKQETLQSMPTMHEPSETPHTIPVVEVCMEKMESQDNDNIQDENSIEDPIGIEKETKEEIQIEILKFNLERQKEMHELEMMQLRERHRLELEILELKKKKLMRDYERLRKCVQSS